MLKQLATVFCLLDDQGVIHRPKPKVGVGGGSAKGFYFKLLLEQVGNEGALMQGIHGCTMDLFIIFTLEEELSMF